MTDFIEVRSEIADWIAENEGPFELIMQAVMGATKCQPAAVPTPQVVPAVKGAIGEEFVFKALTCYYRVKNVAHDSKSGDLTLFVEDLKILVEVKNYTSRIGRPNVDKFERDVTTTVPDGGLFISLHTPIANVTDSFRIVHHQAAEGTVPCIYLVSSIENQMVAAVEMLRGLIRSNEMIKASAVRAIDDAVSPLLDTVDTLAKLRDSMLTFANTTAVTTLKHTANISVVESTIRDQLKTLRVVSVTHGKLSEHERWKNYSTADQNNLTAFVHSVEELFPQEVGTPGWLYTGREAIHPAGYSIKFNAAPRIYGPVGDLTKLSSHLIAKKVNILNGRVETSPENYRLLF
jgi:hypothetical protein